MKTFYQFLTESSSQYSSMHDALRKHGFKHEKTENTQESHRYTWTKLGHTVVVKRGHNQPNAQWSHYDHAKVQHPLLNSNSTSGNGTQSLRQHLNIIDGKK